MWGLERYWWTIPASIMVVLLAAIFRPELRALLYAEPDAVVSPEPTSPVPSAVPSSSGSVAEPPPALAPEPSQSAAPTPAPPTAPPAPPPAIPKAAPRPPGPSEIDGKDAKTWRAMLRGAVMRHDGAIAADAFVALSRIDPTRFRERKAMFDAATAAHLAASINDDLGDRVFDVLAGDRLGHVACDILYRLTSVHGGSRAAKRATKLLADDAVLARATPALRIALEIRDAPCKSRPALFDRAAKEGDERALYLLQAMRQDHCGQISCCMRTDAALAKTIGAIRTRIAETR